MRMEDGRPRQGEDLVAAGFAGLAGTVWIVKRKRDALLQRFSQRYLDNMLELAAYCGEIPRSAAGPERDETASGVIGEDEGRWSAVWRAGEGGILKAVWDFSGSCGLGMTAALRRIPIRQETVELCEWLGLNPYRLYSRGCVLFTAANGGRLAQELNETGVPAAVIGAVTGDFVRRVTVENGLGFLERPRPDELGKIALDTYPFRTEKPG